MTGMNKANPATMLEKDPVCRMNMNPASASHVHPLAGKNYYFCCARCAEKFKADPETYLRKPASARPSDLVMLGTQPAIAKASDSPAHSQRTAPQPLETHAPRSGQGEPAYVCPMCPDVREPKPGACPSCGMALEPDVPLPAT